MRRSDDSGYVAYPTDSRCDLGQYSSQPVIETGANRGVKMTENEANEDVQGHKRPQATEDDDVAGHKRPQATEDDDVQGHHKLRPAATEDDDDVEGHKRPM
jgi:hypothetical protein